MKPDRTTTNTISFGKVEHFLLLGGGITLRNIVSQLKEKNIDVAVISSKRLIGEVVSGVSLRDFLDRHEISYSVTSELQTDPLLKKALEKKVLGISLGAPWIFRKKIIDAFSGRLVNLHSRDLPKDRGGGGSSWLILNGVKRSATTIHLVDEGIDTGEIIKKDVFDFPAHCKTPQQYDDETHKRNVPFMLRFIQEVIEGVEFERLPQDESLSTYFPRLHTLTQGFVDWNWAAEDIERFIDAFDDPYPGASTFIKNKRIFLKKANIVADSTNFHPFVSGVIYRIHDSHVFVATRSGGVRIDEIKTEDGNDLVPEIKPGERLFTPLEYLDNARAFHPVYTPDGLKKQ